MTLGLAGKVALITGGSRGIGRAAVRCFAREGAQVAFTFYQGEDRAEALAKELSNENFRALALPLDLGSPDSILRTCNAVQETWGKIDILVNNAVEWGPRRIADAPPFERLPANEWQRLLRTNIEGPFQLIQAVLPSMREQRWGRIVNVSATLAEDGLPGTGWYATAKSSLHGLTRTLSKELGPVGILVNTIMPGLTATSRAELVSSEARRRVEERIPIRRILTPEEVATVIIFLCSEPNSAITGELVRVSGGRV